jgi:hypothetical protein
VTNLHRHPGHFPYGVKRLGRKTNHPPLSSTDFKNEWSCTSILTYAFMASTGHASSNFYPYHATDVKPKSSSGLFKNIPSFSLFRDLVSEWRRVTRESYSAGTRLHSRPCHHTCGVDVLTARCLLTLCTIKARVHSEMPAVLFPSSGEVWKLYRFASTIKDNKISPLTKILTFLRLNLSWIIPEDSCL